MSDHPVDAPEGGQPTARVRKILPAKTDPIPRPPFRRLRGYAFDPSLSIQLETMGINHIVFKIPWEVGLQKGPVGEYLEVVDYDPASDCFYAPVDLNNTHLIAQDGLAPSESNPQFHQQMVYAVAMTTIQNFEQAMGRKALWRPQTPEDGGRPEFLPRLRIYPHAIREANAYYSPKKRALLFGYFPATANDPGTHLVGGTVFTCLSHDVVAHETTHALLDGMHRRFIENTHPDALAFHEAFADIVALLQHFSFPEVLVSQIAKTRGDLSSENLLGQLAQQFGVAIGGYGSLRDAIGRINPDTQQWEPLTPNPQDYASIMEPHARGSILVAAVFEAFLSIYRSRVADLKRIASGGSGILVAGSLHPDLVNRLAQEAAKAAKHVLYMCIRALDYATVVDLTFGDYLRALITADKDMVPDDDRGYRVAFIEAFRRRGIYPRGVRSLSIESLCWPAARDEEHKDFNLLANKLRRKMVERSRYFSSREEAHNLIQDLGAYLHEQIKCNLEDVPTFERLTGLVLHPDSNLTGLDHDADGIPIFEVHSVRPARRIGPDGNLLNQMVISITQQRKIIFNSANPDTPPFRGGCTLILDLDTLSLSYRIVKPINDDERMQRQLDYMNNSAGLSLRATYFAPFSRATIKEAFALLHREL